MQWLEPNQNRVFKSFLFLGACLVVVQIFTAVRYDTRQLQFSKNSDMRTLLATVYNSTSSRDGENQSLTISFSNSSVPQDNRAETSFAFRNQDSPHVSHVTRSTAGHNSSTTERHHEGHDGFALAANVRESCKSIREKSVGKFYMIQGSVGKRLLYCPMEKIGTTFWRRVLYMLTAPNGKTFKNPYDVPIEKALKSDKLYTVSRSIVAQRFLKSNSFDFLFVRNPFSRLLSAFVDKLVAPNPYYWQAFGSKAIMTFRKNASLRSKHYGHDVTFPEFVKHVTVSEKTKRNLDPHYISTFSSCKPCQSNYKYIGKMETFKDDALFILDKIGLNSTVKILSEGNTFRNLTTDDAISDSIYSPFGWRKNVLPIISWEKALRRMWLKLQMRAIIPFSESFDSYVNSSAILNMTAEQFIEHARKAHAQSRRDELKQQKTEVMKEAFLMLHLDDLVAFRNAYQYDFHLYGYDESPVLLFDRLKEPQMPSKYFSYDHLN